MSSSQVVYVVVEQVELCGQGGFSVTVPGASTDKEEALALAKAEFDKYKVKGCWLNVSVWSYQGAEKDIVKAHFQGGKET
jgi:hypothetical protein